MSDTMRWRYGDTNPVVAAVDSATVIEIGDLVFQDTDDAKPASAQADQGTEAANQELFVHSFLGVAMQRSSAGQTDAVRVASTGVFELDCASSTFELGDLVGLQEDASGESLRSQLVTKVTDPRYAVGRVAKRVPVAATSVLVDIRSTIMTGGVQGSWPSGV